MNQDTDTRIMKATRKVRGATATVRQQKEAEVSYVPVPWYPPIGTSTVRPGADPGQTEINFRFDDCSK